MQGAGEIALEFSDGLNRLCPEAGLSLARSCRGPFPAGVGSISRPSRSTSFSPSESSSARICSLTVGCDKADGLSRLGETLQIYNLAKNHKPVDIHSASFRRLAPRRPNPAAPFPSESFPLSASSSRTFSSHWRVSSLVPVLRLPVLRLNLHGQFSLPVGLGVGEPLFQAIQFGVAGIELSLDAFDPILNGFSDPEEFVSPARPRLFFETSAFLRLDRCPRVFHLPGPEADRRGGFSRCADSHRSCRGKCEFYPILPPKPCLRHRL